MYGQIYYTLIIIFKHVSVCRYVGISKKYGDCMNLKYSIIITGIIISCVLMNTCNAMEYKWASSIPVKYVPLSAINNSNQLNHYLNSKNIVIFYMDGKYNPEKDNWILYKFNITRVNPGIIPNYGNYSIIDTDEAIVVYHGNGIYRSDDGTLIYTTPMYVNNSKYKIQHITPTKHEIYDVVPNYYGYELLSNGTVIVYPKKYVKLNNNVLIFNPPANDSGYVNYTYSYKKYPKVIPEYYNYILINKGNVIIYPKKYVKLNSDDVLIFNPPANITNNVPIYNVSTKLIDAKNGIYEIKSRKLLITHPIDPNSKQALDIAGWCVSENNGTFVYINEVPPNYKHVVISGVVVQKIVPNEYGDYAIDVAGRKIRVSLINDTVVAEKIRTIKLLSQLLDINITYISTGSESINVVKKNYEDIGKSELDSLLDDYWFKNWQGDEYTHIYYNPANIRKKYNIGSMDVLAMSYYPIIYADKAPETFKNDPVGGYYPETVSYKGTPTVGYWEKGASSQNEYYHYDSGEPHWSSHGNYTSNWYYEGKAVLPRNDSEMNNRYKYFNYWFVKNYGYALSEGVNGLLLTSSDKYLVDAILGKENQNISWKLDINKDKDLKYVVIPDNKEVYLENNITIIDIPGLTNNETYGMHYIGEYYLPPKDEDFGVYIADITKYDYNKIYSLKNNYTWICSFKNYVDWANKYIKNDVRITSNKTIYLKSNKNTKITVYKKHVGLSKLYNLTIEDYNEKLNKIVIDNPPHYLNLN